MAKVHFSFEIQQHFSSCFFFQTTFLVVNSWFGLTSSHILQIEGNLANADDAIMLDKDGFVSETNATNIVRQFLISRCILIFLYPKILKCIKSFLQFMVKKGHVSTPHADYCLPGITRATVSSIIYISELCQLLVFKLKEASTCGKTKILFHGKSFLQRRD